MRVLAFASAIAFALVLLQPIGPASSTALGNAAYVDAGGALHAATFAYAGACDGPGTVTVRLLDTGAILTADVQSKTVGNTCGASLSCLDCPPVPEAYAWELTGLGVVLAGGGPAYYEQYSDHPLAYVLSGQYLGGALTAWATS